MSHHTDSSSPEGEGGTFASPSPAAIAAGLLASYRERDKIFGGDFFGAPAWEVLLALQVNSDGLPVDAICALLQSKRSITARWLDILIMRGLVAHSHQDGEVIYRLTKKAQLGLAKLLRAAFAAMNEPLSSVRGG